MLNQLPALDRIVLVALLLFLTFASTIIGLKKKNAEDYFMAGRSLRWWSVAGSIYGTNVTVSQIIGMLGVGYTIGFAQSHYEVLAILPILALAYIFIPVYRKREVFTLSQFLAHRYDDRARLAYAVINILFILVQLVAFFYIGSRQLMLLLHDSAVAVNYGQGIVLIAVVTCLFTVFGGMESVVIADNIQTVLMVFAAVAVGLLTFAQPEIGGFSGLLQLESALPRAEQKMHLYLPTSHPDLPWTGAFTGLMVLHFFYWTTNQYQVQRVLAAASDRDARLGVIAAGFLKMSIPFFSIAAGVAAAHLFRARFGETSVKSDDAFLRLMQLVVPMGYGLAGAILAGLISAIFSAIYSMMNSVTTLASVDIYQRYLRPQATDRETVRFGRLTIVVLCAIASWAAWTTFDPNSKSNFFIDLSRNTSYLKPGIVVAFFAGILWRKADPFAALLAIVAAPVFGLFSEWAYAQWLGPIPAVSALFGVKLNFMHRVFLTTLFCAGLIVVLSLRQSRIKMAETGFDFDQDYSAIWRGLAFFAAGHALLAGLTWSGWLPLPWAALLGGAYTIALFVPGWYQPVANHTPEPYVWYQSDRFYAALLAGLTVAILYYFA